ncbi:Zinc_finger domain-containing protein [Hexamita inflata]|uniref:Zinc finger domain-containing protein n=1 Tax=Hexamita inflata TaxID=28002 RepID=A0AA86RC91_9EUKA|nr:Zinc finger domain-containing protein [Hexamita inflata]
MNTQPKESAISNVIREMHFVGELEQQIEYCAYSLDSSHLYFMCDTCGSDSVIYCQQCLLNARDIHKGHVIRCVTDFTGLCDCGDVSALNPECFCHQHQMKQTNYQPAVLKYFYDFVIDNETEFNHNYHEACKLTHILFQKDSKQEQVPEILKVIGNRPRVMRMMTIVLFFAGQNINVHDLFQIQKNFNQTVNFNFEYQKTSYMCNYLRDEIKNDFYHNYLTQDFLFRVLLAKVYTAFATENTDCADSLSQTFVQSLTEPYSQYMFIQWNFIDCLIDKITICTSNNNYDFAYQFYAAVFYESPIFYHSLMNHQNSPNYLLKIAQMHQIVNQKGYFNTNQQYKNSNQFVKNINKSLDSYGQYCHNLLLFVWYIHIKQDISYEQLQNIKSNFVANEQDCYIFQFMNLEEFVHKYQHHISKLKVLVIYYHENNFFCDQENSIGFLPIYILQVYLSRICDIFKVDADKLIHHILLELNIDMTVDDFISKLFYNWIRTLAFCQMVRSQQYFKKYLYDLSDIVEYLDFDDLFKTTREQVIHSMQILLPYCKKSLKNIYEIIQQIDNKQSEIVDQIFIQIINMIFFLPSPYDKKQYLSYLIATKYSGSSYNEILDAELDQNFKVSWINNIFQELFEIKIADEVCNAKYSLKKLEYIEPALSGFHDEDLINKYSEDLVKQLSRIINSSKIANQFASQLTEDTFLQDIVKRVSQRQNSISNQICLLRLSQLFPNNINIVFTNNLLRVMQNQMSPQTENVQQQTQKISAKDKFSQLKEKQNQSQALTELKQVEQIDNEAVDETIILCDKCHLQIQDVVQYPFQTVWSCFGQEQKQVYRTCGHKFHDSCIQNQKKCPVCQKYFQLKIKLDLNYQYGDEMDGFINALTNMHDVLSYLASEPLISESLRQRYLSQYLKETSVMIPCCKQIYHSDMVVSLPAPENALDFFKKPDQQPLIHENALRESNFDYLQDALTAKCSSCQNGFTLNSDFDMCVCLHCGQYTHLKCAHACRKLLLNVSRNQLETDEFTINAYYKNQFKELQYSCVDPELFLDKDMLSQVIVNLILGEAKLQPNQEWVIHNEDGEEWEEYDEMEGFEDYEEEEESED